MPRNAVRDEAGERADHNINLNRGQIIAALITAAGVIVAAFVTGAFSGHAVGLVSKPTVTVTTTVTAPSATGTGGSPAPSATPNSTVYWSSTVGITASGLEFDTRPPSQAGPSGGIAYAGNTLSASNQNIVVSLWTNSGTPSAAQCQSWVSTHPNTGVESPTPGMNICIKTAEGRIGLLQIDSGTNNGQLQATVTIWGS